MILFGPVLTGLVVYLKVRVVHHYSDASMPTAGADDDYFEGVVSPLRTEANVGAGAGCGAGSGVGCGEGM